MCQETYKNIATAGAVKTPPNKQNAPGNVCNVAVYNVVYIGAYNKGINASATPNNEFTLPSSSFSTSLVAIDRIAINEVPFNISTKAPRYICIGRYAKAYTKLDNIFDILDITPINASSILSLWEKTPTENRVPIELRGQDNLVACQLITYQPDQ